MATPPAPDPGLVPVSGTAHDFSALVAAYLPSPSSEDDADVADDDLSFLADDSPDSLDDWSDDCPDYTDDCDHDSESDDSSLAWNPSKPKKHTHSHVHHKKANFQLVCDYLTFFGALRKGFCSRPLDQRIEVYKAQKRADKSTGTGGGDSIQQEKKRVVKTGTGGVSGGHAQKGASSFGAMFKCTVADTPKNLLKRASFSENSDELDINTYEVGAETARERDAAEIDKKSRQKVEMEGGLEFLERDGKGSSEVIDGPQVTDNVCKDMAHKEYGEAHVELEPNALPNRSKLKDGNSNSKEDDQSSKHNKASDKRSSWRESDQKGLHKKGESKHAMPDGSNKSSKNENQVSLVNSLEPKDKSSVSLENNTIQQSKDLQVKMVPSKDNADEAVEMAEVPTPSDKKVMQTEAVEKDKKVTQTKAVTDKAKVQDMPLQIYIKEKHPPDVVVKDPKRKTKAKKAKASKGKKLHLFRDGFTLPSATEPADDAESTAVLDGQSESSNKVQSPNASVKNKISKEVVSTSATDDMQPPPIIGKLESNVVEVVDRLSLGDATGPVATPKTSVTPVHIIETQIGNTVSNDSGLSVVALPGSVPNAASNPSASYQNMEDDSSKISLAEGRQAAQPEAPPPPLKKSSRRWFPPLDVTLLDPAPASELATTLRGSLLVPQSLVGNSLETFASSYSPTVLSHESESKSESFRNIQGNLVPTGNIISSAAPNPPSFIEAPSTSYHLGKRVTPPVIVSSSPRILTMDANSAQYSRLIQVPVSQSQGYAPNSAPTLSLQQEINPPSLFHVDSRGNSKSSWIQPGSNSGPGFPFPIVPATSFGQVIGCVNQTLSMYKQMKSFSIEARYLVNVPSIVPGCCKLFIFNIESRQLHGLYVSSSFQALPVGHEFSVAFDCIENYSIPLSVDELDTILPEARQMDGRPLFLQPHTVEQLVAMFERKNNPRLSWVPSTTNAVSVSGGHGLLELSAVSSESSSTQDRLVKVMGQGSSMISASPASMAINEAAKDCWSPLSSSPSAKGLERGQAFAAHEPDISLAPSQVFPFASSTNNGEGAKSVWSDVAQSGFTRKLPEQGVAPSPMALWPHLFPKATSADATKENIMHMETREGNTQTYHASVSEKLDIMGTRPDSESEALSFSQLPESGIRSTAYRPKLAYNPLAVEQDRQRHLFDGSKSSSWSTLIPELDLQQTSQYGNRPRSQDNQYIASLSAPLISEQLKMNNINAGATKSSAALAAELPLHYEMDRALPDSLRSDLGLSQTDTAQTISAWSEEPYSMHLPTTSSEAAKVPADLDQTNLCCYCFTRRADHLIMDCRHLGPCLECAASKKIEYCGQLNCQTKVTRLLRLFL